MTAIVTPVNVATVTAALVAQLANWPGVADLKARVESAEQLNETPGRCPWIGVYRDSVKFVVKTLGYGSGARNQHISLVLAVQESDPVSGEKCEARLEALLQQVLGALLTDVTIGGTVQVINQLRYTFGAMEYGAAKTIGYRIEIDVKLHGSY